MITAKVRVGELGRVVTGRTPPAASPQFFGSDYPFITPSDIQDGVRFLSTERAISQEGAAAFSRIVLPPHAVCVVCIGATIGKLCLTDRPSVTNQQINSIIVDQSRFDPFYVFSQFRLLGDQLKSRASGAATPIMNKSSFEDVEIEAPPDLPTQRRIADILSAYDDLIELNQRRIAILEEMARRLFEEWFVRFRYPGCEEVVLVETLPAGWSHQPLSALCSYINRGISPAYVEEGGSVVINQKCIRHQRLDLSVARLQSKSPPTDKLIQRGDVLINSTGVGTLGRVAQVFEVPEGATVDTHVTIARAAANVDHIYFGALLLSLESDFERMGEGSTGQTELGRSRIGGQAVLIPPTQIMSRYGQLAEPMRLMGHSLQQTNSRLRAARDLLLPKLISGEIDVSAAPAPDDIARDAA